jgi:RND family efflux transporter MFP subunit
MMWKLFKKNLKIIVYSLLSILVLIVILSITCRRHPAQVSQNTLVESVKAVSLSKKEVNDFYEITGTVKAKNISIIASRIPGTVTTIGVHQGDRVKVGQELLTIENTELTQRLAAAQAAHEEAVKSLDETQEARSLIEVDYKRYKNLAAQKVITAQEMDRIESQKKIADLNYERSQSAVKRAQATLEEVRANLEYSHILAPVDGVVTHKQIDAGSMAAAGMPLLTVEDISGFEVYARVNEQLAGHVTVGTAIKIDVDAISASFETPITEVAPSIDSASRTFMIKAAIKTEPNQPQLLKTGLFARVFLPQGKRFVLAVPAKALVEKGQLLGVYVEDGGIIHYRLIRTGKHYNDQVEVLSGLKEGDKVFIDGVQNLVDGQSVVQSALKQ